MKFLKMFALVVVTLSVLAIATPPSVGVVSGSVGCGDECENFVVYLQGPPAQTADDGVVSDFDQKDKVFVPHVLPVLQGTTINIKNSDPFLHNVHTYLGSDTVMNMALPIKGMEVPWKPEQSGRYNVVCDAHPEMTAFIVVLENPYFASLAEDGSYEIADVPAGTYTLVVYDAESGKQTTSSVTVN